MLKSESSPSESRKPEALKSLLTKSLLAKSFFLFAIFLVLPSWAGAQSFTLQAGPLSEDAVAPGGVSSAQVAVGTVNGFTGAVDLTCQVAPAQPQSNLVDTPSCAVSPATVTPPASASATITTMGLTSNVRYGVTVTGTAASNAQTTTTPALYMTVLAVAPQFTITVEKATEPGSVPAGNSGVAMIDINPINGYTTATGASGITLSCSSITPVVTIPPICSFSPNPVKVSGTGTFSSTLTISTYGPVVTTGAVVRPRSFYATFYALWLPLPMLALVGLSAGGRRARKAWGLLAFFVLSGTLLLMPACGSNTTTSTATPNGVTPNGTYTFTVSGVDNNGVVSSNSGTGSTNPAVTLTVTTATE